MYFDYAQINILYSGQKFLRILTSIAETGTNILQIPNSSYISMKCRKRLYHKELQNKDQVQWETQHNTHTNEAAKGQREGEKS